VQGRDWDCGETRVPQAVLPVGLRSRAVTPGCGARGRPCLPQSQTFLCAPRCKAVSWAFCWASTHFRWGTLRKPRGTRGRGSIP
jgi:hypothetical protein